MLLLLLNMINTKNNYSILNSKLFDLLDTYNAIDILPDKYNLKKKTIDSQLHQELIDNISNQMFNNDTLGLYENLIKIKNLISNCLIKQILSNSPKSDITITKFPNIKTELYPYQINNLNWMIRIEKQDYIEEYKEISSKYIIRGGGLFDEVGMGKTLQIITLINLNVSTNTSLEKKNKIFAKGTLIIVPNHLCGQWLREFTNHTIKPITIINLLTKVHYHKFTYYDLINADVVIINANFFINCNLNQHEKSNPLAIITDIFKNNVNIFNIYWYRVVIDEFHEIKNSNLFIKLKYLESDYRWIISGTPFNETFIFNYSEIDKTSLSEILDYLTWDLNVINKINIYNKINYQYIQDHFSRNTHNDNIKILQLPEVNEQIIWLKFTNTERMIYNAYLADPNNNSEDIFLRQICCHPMISKKLQENISCQVESLYDIQIKIKKMYMSDFEKIDVQYMDCLNKIDKINNDITLLEKENKTHLITYSNLKSDLDINKSKLVDLKKIRDGKEKTVMYYKKFIELLGSMENVTQQDCTICLDKIKEEDLGITFCGHIYCYSCISTIIKESKTSYRDSKCPNCQKSLQLDKIFLISKNKSEEVNNLGTKMAWIIDYIKKTPNKYRIIFSQWDYLLKEIGKVLESNGIHNLYCQGNVYQKDKVLKLFNMPNDSPEAIKIIMLSSDSTVSGSNLNNAEEVIFLDPIYGDKQHVINTERQAIGRVIRLGNKHKIINIIRILIKDSIEEDNYKINQNQN